MTSSFQEIQTVNIGALIIGSLYWDKSQHRRNWRRDRLDMDTRFHVKVPIRYGRRSRSRGCSYTMVFSPGLPEAQFGHGIVVPFKSRDVVKEAEYLWTAERDRGTSNQRISADWGCIALVENPERPIHHEARHAWTERLGREPCYAQMFNTPLGQEAPVNKSGFLMIPWPAAVSGSPLKFNILIATATNPTITAGHYPTAQQIAAAWNTSQGMEHRTYFQYNRDSGIQTYRDPEIARLLDDNSSG